MSQTEYAYDKQGNLILEEKHSTEMDGHTLRDILKTEYTYDSAGNCLTEKKTSSLEGTEDKVYTDLEYQYDSDGNKIREIKNFDIREQQEGVAGASSYVEVTDTTLKISCGPDEFITFTYWFEANGSLKLKDESTGNTISLHTQ